MSSFSPENFWKRADEALATARKLLEIDYNAAASRSYYAAFYAVSALFLCEGKVFSKHSGIMAAVHRDLVKTNRWPSQFGEDYSWLQGLRTVGDYGLERTVSAEEAADAVRRATTLVQAARESSVG